ncbi:MAG: 4Fe-4S dicluster domain-containing protein [Saprospiraceae bacterium]
MSSDQHSPDVFFDEVDGYRDSIGTVSADGKRIWLRPEKPKGYFYDKRKILSYLLLAVMVGLPFIEINGEPLFLFDVLGRQFRIFGIGYSPQDFYLAGLMMVTSIVAIAMFTVTFGRLFCGWICPQTIFMEMVYRRVEYWVEGSAAQQRRLDKSPWDTKKIWKRLLKHTIFFLIAVGISHVFLSYMIGWREVYQVASDPIVQHTGGFAALMGFSLLFYGVFARLREQVCISICPYGRMQSVLVDDDTIGVAYDVIRGEPRGKVTKAKKLSPPLHEGLRTKPPTTPSVLEMVNGLPISNDASVAGFDDVSPAGLREGPIKVQGDCIDCGLCVRVCPTGIDIRDGNNQLECVHCTACIDACDDIMVKVGKEPGLIRYDSANGLKGKRSKYLTKRTYAYGAVLLALVTLNSFLLINRAPLEATIVRTPGMLYQEPEPGMVSNLYNYQFYNKTSEPLPVTIQAVGLAEARVTFIGEAPVVGSRTQARGSFFIQLPKTMLTGKSTLVTIEILDSNGEQLDAVQTSFLGPSPGQ